jgi:type II secretory pathway pseudopilin PulG
MPIGERIYSHQKQRGFTFIAVLAAMFLLALGTQKVMAVLSQQAQREREAELLQIGAAFAQAIGMYYESSPGSIKRWPQSLNELTDDTRFVSMRRHLRQVYLDPMTRSNQWGVLRAGDGGILGIYSLSDATPIRSGGIELANLSLTPASHYSDWQFVYHPPLVNPIPKLKP